MYATSGVGLAAPQVGISHCLFVMNPTGDAKNRESEMILVNPVITKKTGKEWGQEGCLSFPGIYSDVMRGIEIIVEAVRIRFDDDGEPKAEEIAFAAQDFMARVIQHELDHLSGILFIDRFTPADKIRVKQSLEELERRHRETVG